MKIIQTQDNWLDAQYTLKLMIEHRKERREGWTYLVVHYFPKLTDLDTYTFLGSFAWSQPANRLRWMKANYLFDYGAGLVTPSDIARDYLHVKYGNVRLRCNKLQYKELVKKRKTQPLYAEPCTLDRAYYLDLKSAYWQILMSVGWDVDYLPNGFLAVRSDNRDFPVPSQKIARNCLVSMGLPSSVTTYHPERGLQRHNGKQVVNLVLWGLVQDVLHGFASDMIEVCDAKYVNTDGYIVHADMLRDAMNVADSWGLTLTIREQGRAVIRGAGDYDIGGHVSKRPRRLPLRHEYIQPRAKDWLRKRFKFYSSRIDLDLKHTQLLSLE